MTNRVIETGYEREMFLKFIQDQKLPFTITLTEGKRRSVEQNRLQRLWMNEISEQIGDMTPEEVRGYCKLTIGVPILRAENEAFQKSYDEFVRPLPYEQKHALMMEPLDLPITRLMSVKQKAAYLDGVTRHYAERGIILTCPDDMFGPERRAAAENAERAA